MVNTEKDTHNEIVNVSKETIVLDNDVDVDEYNLLLPTNGKLSKPGSILFLRYDFSTKNKKLDNIRRGAIIIF